MCNVDLDSITSSEYPEDVSFVTKYQKLIGELFYLSVNTMPEIRFFEMSCLTRYMTQREYVDLEIASILTDNVDYRGRINQYDKLCSGCILLSKVD